MKYFIKVDISNPDDAKKFMITEKKNPILRYYNGVTFDPYKNKVDMENILIFIL